MPIFGAHRGIHLRCGWSVQYPTVLSGRASRLGSVVKTFGRESFNSAEGTFTSVVVGFIVARSFDGFHLRYGLPALLTVALHTPSRGRSYRAFSAK